MSNTKKINRLLAVTAACAAIVTLAVPVAFACGPYGPPSDEQAATWAVWDADYAEGEREARRLEVDHVRVVAGRVAVVTGTIVGREPATATYVVVKVGGTWPVALRGDTSRRAAVVAVK